MTGGIDELVHAASRALCVGIGGGGDVVGALAVAETARTLGTPCLVGGLSWERRVVDPVPGPRVLDEVEHAERLNDCVALARAETRGPGGFAFAESRVAGLLGEPTVLVDPNPGPARVAAGLADAAGRLGCDLVILLDVGGDVLAHGHEPGLGSPLADAVMLAAGARLAERMPVVAAIFGTGCDGELTPDEVLTRLAEVAGAGGFLGVWTLAESAVELLRRAVAEVPTEASAQGLACALNEVGPAPIRDGRRTVERSALGGLTLFFDPRAAVASAARLAAAVAGAESLEAADALLHELGVRTELAYEVDVARERPRAS